MLLPDDMIVEKMCIHYGQKNKNPVDNLRFFSKIKSEPHRKYQQQLTPMKSWTSPVGMGYSPRTINGDRDKTRILAKRVQEVAYETRLPRVFMEQSIRVFCKDNPCSVRGMSVHEESDRTRRLYRV